MRRHAKSAFLGQNRQNFAHFNGFHATLPAWVVSKKANCLVPLTLPHYSRPEQSLRHLASAPE
jgi:hypothetical protein